MEQKELSFIAGWSQDGIYTLEVRLAVSYKTKHALTKLKMKSSICTPWYFAKGVENFCLHINLHMDVYSGFIHNCQN